MNSGLHSQFASQLPESIQPAAGMWVTVVRLRRNGVKYKGDQEVGYLVLREVTDQRYRAFYSRSEALLYRQKDQSKGSIGAILCDPQLLRWDDRGVFIQGWEVCPDGDNPSSQRLQVWCVKPAPKTESTVSKYLQTP